MLRVCISEKMSLLNRTNQKNKEGMTKGFNSQPTWTKQISSHHSNWTVFVLFSFTFISLIGLNEGTWIHQSVSKCLVSELICWYDKEFLFTPKHNNARPFLWGLFNLFCSWSYSGPTRPSLTSAMQRKVTIETSSNMCSPVYKMHSQFLSMYSSYTECTFLLSTVQQVDQWRHRVEDVGQ